MAALFAAAALAVPFIAKWEGRPERGYRDPVGVPTACYGHTGPEVVVGRVYTDAECMAFLGRDVVEHGLRIDRCLTRVPPQPLYAATLDLAHNAGTAAVCASGLVRRINAGDWAGACAELPKWRTAGGRVLPGLVNRRADAVNTFCKPLLEGRA